MLAAPIGVTDARWELFEIPLYTNTCDGLSPLTQCAAVKIQVLEIIEPPHCLPPAVSNTCHGTSVMVVGEPPTIRGAKFTSAAGAPEALIDPIIPTENAAVRSTAAIRNPTPLFVLIEVSHELVARRLTRIVPRRRRPQEPSGGHAGRRSRTKPNLSMPSHDNHEYVSMLVAMMVGRLTREWPLESYAGVQVEQLVAHLRPLVTVEVHCFGPVPSPSAPSPSISRC